VIEDAVVVALGERDDHGPQRRVRDPTAVDVLDCGSEASCPFAQVGGI